MGVTMTLIGTMRTPFGKTGEIPKGPDAKHDAEGINRDRSAIRGRAAGHRGLLAPLCAMALSPHGRVRPRRYPPSDDRPHGVFATRSPRRPSPIGLTVVQLLRRDSSRLHVRGVDMLDGTPVLDIKPYLSGVPDSDVRRGWLAAAEERRRSSS